MKEIDVKNIETALKNAIADPKVGIRIAPLINNEEFGMYVTQIPSKQKITAHYHQAGLEIYGIISGSGLIHTAVPLDNGEYKNKKSKQVSAGDYFCIEANIIHQLQNTGNEPLILVFGCPATHLSTDRILSKDLIED